MRAEELAQLVRRKPFQPIRLHLTTGQSYDIRHPEFIIIQRQSAEVGLDPDPKTGVVDRVEYLSLLHVVRIENIESPIGPAKGNGGGLAVSASEFKFNWMPRLRSIRQSTLESPEASGGWLWVAERTTAKWGGVGAAG